MNNNELEKNPSLRSFITKHQLLMFFIFTFAITWGIAAIVLIFLPWLIQVCNLPDGLLYFPNNFGARIVSTCAEMVHRES